MGTPPAAGGGGAGPLSATERRATWSLALIYAVRMLGLFIVLPVFTLFAGGYTHATPLLIGLAIGIYGLLQAALQIPFGMLSDRIGRKRVITLGLVLLATGSTVAALADDIRLVILGRALQGAGAIAAALMALAADLTRDEQRTKVMAMLGASIGLSFVLALVLGPVLIGWYSIEVLFWLTALCALLAIVLLHTVVPDPPICRHSADTGADPATLRRLLRHPMLLRLDASIFLLHLIITATFFSVPLALQGAGIGAGAQWQVHLGAFAVSLAIAVPLMALAERRAMRGALLACAAGLLGTQLLIGAGASGVLAGSGGAVETAGSAGVAGVAGAAWLLVAMVLFFGFLTALEALLPSLVSRLAPAAAKGSAMGIYSSAQFLGVFVGGTGAGWLHGAFGSGGLHLAMVVLCALWMLLLAGFVPPRRVITRRRPLDAEERTRPEAVLAELAATPGVEEAVLAVDENVIYLKVDRAVHGA